MKCDCLNGAILNGMEEPLGFNFILDEPRGYIICCKRETIQLKDEEISFDEVYILFRNWRHAKCWFLWWNFNPYCNLFEYLILKFYLLHFLQMSHKKFEPNGYCVGGRQWSATISIENEVTKTGQKYSLVIVFKVK